MALVTATGAPSSKQRWLIGGLAVVAVLIVAGAAGYSAAFPKPHHYDSEVDHLKYGSVGVEAAAGVPYRVWAALPAICPDKLPEASRSSAQPYQAFGFIFEPGHATPIGMPLETVIVPRVGVNCGLCHVATVRGADGEAPRLLIGAPNTKVDLQRYLRFLFACTASPAFTPDRLIPAMKAQAPLNPIETALYRFAVIPQMKTAVAEQARQLNWMDRVPDWGPGRVDGFNPAKTQVLNLPFDGTIDAVDIPPLWNWRPRENFGLHWDGINTSLREVFLNSGIGNGADAHSINIPNLDRLRTWVLNLKPPAYPFPIDRTLAAQGQPIFQSQCASCHAFGGAKVGEVIPVSTLGTDRNRLDAWTPQALRSFQRIDKYSWRYTHFRKTDGYVATPLDGIWARAPYLHNGSVPTLTDLLSPPEARPTRFWRGYDVYDQQKGGFVADGPAAMAAGRLYDTAQPGNANQGHSFGTDLSEADRHALVEYLKTL